MRISLRGHLNALSRPLDRRRRGGGEAGGRRVMGDRPVYQVDPKRYHTDDILAEGAGTDPSTARMIAECQAADGRAGRSLTNDGALDKGDALFLRSHTQAERQERAARDVDEKLQFARMRAAADRDGGTGEDRGEGPGALPQGRASQAAKRPLASKPARGVPLASIRVSRRGGAGDKVPPEGESQPEKRLRGDPALEPAEAPTLLGGALGSLLEYSDSGSDSGGGGNS